MTPIVAATPAHAAALACIHAAAFPPGEQWGRDAIELQLGLFGVSGLVSGEGGFILVRVVADEAEILTLAVDPAVRRRGLGGRLLRQALAEAYTAGARTMFLEVSARNGAAQALYAANGFAEIGRRSGYYPGGVDALVLRTLIASAAGDG